MPPKKKIVDEQNTTEETVDVEAVEQEEVSVEEGVIKAASEVVETTPPVEPQPVTGDQLERFQSTQAPLASSPLHNDVERITRMMTVSL